jgi:hypothetical protein
MVGTAPKKFTAIMAVIPYGRGHPYMAQGRRAQGRAGGKIPMADIGRMNGGIFATIRTKIGPPFMQSQTCRDFSL